MTTFPLADMTREEKLAAMEALWADLTTDEAAFESPAWHGEALAETEKMVKTGQAHFVDLDEAKARLAQGRA